jgi:hypothetical protein
MEWLGRAQDAAAGEGASPGWSFHSGWAAGDADTGGRLVETLVPAAVYLASPQLSARSHALRDNLLAACGAATPDNVLGLIAVHVHLDCPDSLTRAVTNAHTLADIRIESAAQSAQAGRALAVAGRIAGDRVLLDAARRHVQAAHARQTPCGWFPEQNLPASTLTLAATLHDLLEAATWLDDAAALQRVARAASELAGQLTAEGRLAGVHDDGWMPVASHVCLTGLARLACVWIRLAQIEGGPLWHDAAWRALAWIKRHQRTLGDDPVLCNALPSTVPSWAGARAFRLESLTLKYFADALMMDMAGVTIPPVSRTHETR